VLDDFLRHLEHDAVARQARRQSPRSGPSSARATSSNWDKSFCPSVPMRPSSTVAAADARPNSSCRCRPTRVHDDGADGRAGPASRSAAPGASSAIQLRRWQTWDTGRADAVCRSRCQRTGPAALKNALVAAIITSARALPPPAPGCTGAEHAVGRRR
jgi:hypothetical protein